MHLAPLLSIIFQSNLNWLWDSLSLFRIADHADISQIGLGVWQVAVDNVPVFRALSAHSRSPSPNGSATTPRSFHIRLNCRTSADIDS